MQKYVVIHFGCSLNISKVFRSIIFLLSYPNSFDYFDNGNLQAFELYKTDREKFNNITREWTKKYAT